MIQEPINQIYSSQTYVPISADKVTVTGMKTLSLKSIPIVINTELNQKVLLITKPVNQAQRQQQCPQTIVKQRIISVPFLPRSEPITLLAKKILPTKNVSVKNSSVETALISHNTRSAQTQTLNILTNTAYHQQADDSPNSNSILSNSLFKSCAAQELPAPITLASMAGIQLAGSEESLLDMSGAMPTATVEAINVPVFIDEYLQQQSPKTAAIINNNNYNNKGNDICIENGTYENFEFDIEMIADNNTEDQMCNSDESGLYDSMRNYNNHPNIFVSDNVILNDLKEEELEQQFRVLPCEENDVFFSEDTISHNISHDINMYSSEEAIDISHFTNDELSFSEIFTSSQHNPMLCDGVNISANNSQTLFANAEPFLPNYEEDNKIEDTSMKMSNSQNLVENGCHVDQINLDIIKTENKNATNQNSNLKRCGSRIRLPSQNMAQKRRKLHLDTSQPCMPVLELKTPDVIKLITEMGNDEHEMNSKNTADIINELLSCSNSSFQSVTTEMYTSITSTTGDIYSNYNDDESPCTPRSYTSSHTNHTDYTTSPNSPALSSTSTRYSSTKRKRGRPSKVHSDRPDPSQLRNLSENDRKRLEDRAKNNEASRLSRLKNKVREEAEMEEEKILTTENDRLKAEINLLDWKVEKLKKALKRMHFTAVQRAQ